jgi:hypothetical protein
MLLLIIWRTHFDDSPQKIKQQLKTTEEFCTEINNKFTFVFESNDSAIKMNLNVDKLFYDKDEYKAQMEIYNNEVEAIWKRRVLMVNTPRGNVIMYYDPYKMGFTYYSDVFIPYSILNAVSMKYCMTYRCLDFFMDEFIIPHSYKNDLIKLHKEEEKKNDNKNKIDSNIMKNAPFAKLKNYNHSNNISVSSKGIVTQTSTSTKSRLSDNKLHMNMFIYLGKTSNYSILQKLPKNNSINKQHQNEITAKKISWSEFKTKSYNHTKHMSSNNIPEASVTHKVAFDENYPTQHTQLFYNAS